MDFFQVIDPSILAPRSALITVVEIAMLALFAVLVGAALILVPAMMVPEAKKQKRSRSQAPRSTTAVPAPAAAAPTTSSARPRGVESAASARAAPPTAEEGKFLDTVLDSFFAEQSVLDEALMDTVVATAHGEKPVIASPPRQKIGTAPSATRPRDRAAKPSTRPPRADIDSDLASKMMRGLAEKPRAAPARATASPPRTVPASVVKPATEDDLLDAAFGDLRETPTVASTRPQSHCAPDPEDNLFDLAMREATNAPSKLGALEEIDEL